MKLTKKVKFGINAVNALKGATGPVRIQDLAVEVGTTVNFLAQIMRSLRNAGIVTVRRGPGGGYTLNTGVTLNVTAYSVAAALGSDFVVVGLEGTPVSRLSNAVTEAYLNTVI